MAKSSDNQADSFGTENTGGLLTGFLAEEENFDRRFLLKLGTWGAASVGAVIIALMASQSSGSRRDQIASADLMRQLQQVQLLHRESQNETRRLASALETLNADRDRLFSRVTALELSQDTATGALARQGSTGAPSALPTTPPAPPAAAPVDPQPAPQAATPPTSNQQASKPAPVVAQVATVTPASGPTQEKKQAAVIEPAPATVSSMAPPAAEPSKEPLKETLKEPPRETAKETAKETSKEGSKDASGKAATAGPAANTPATTPAPLVAARSMMGPPDPAATKPTDPPAPATAVVAAPMPDVVASVVDSDSNATAVAVQHTEFAVDVGSANSLSGLRALWRGLLKSNSALGALRPIVMVRESNTGFGMQLRLAAGPLSDAATAAKICAALIESERPCETTVFDGQRLAMKPDEQPPTASKPAKPTQHRRSYYPKRAAVADPPVTKPEPITFSSLFSRRKSSDN